MSQFCRVNLSISADMVQAYINEILTATTVSLSHGDMEESTNDEEDTLLDLLGDYAEANGLPDISGMYNPNGIDHEKMNEAGLNSYYAKMVADGYGESYVCTVLAIPGEVASKVWGARARDPIYIVLGEDRNSRINITDPAKAPKGPDGKPLPQFEKKIMVGGENYMNDKAYNDVIYKVMKDSAAQAMRSYWKKMITQRLQSAATSPQYLEKMLKGANNVANRSKVDKINVTDMRNTRIRFKTGEGECDFIATVTTEYIWELNAESAKDQQEKARVAPKDVMQYDRNKVTF